MSCENKTDNMFCNNCLNESTNDDIFDGWFCFASDKTIKKECSIENGFKNYDCKHCNYYVNCEDVNYIELFYSAYAQYNDKTVSEQKAIDKNDYPFNNWIAMKYIEFEKYRSRKINQVKYTPRNFLEYLYKLERNKK